MEFGGEDSPWRRDSLGQLLPEAEPLLVTLADVRRCHACFVCPHHCGSDDAATGSNDKGWDEEHEFRSWKQLFMLEMEERLVRAHKDYHESVQSNINSTVQFLAALVALLGTISLILFTETTWSGDNHEGAEARNINDSGISTTAAHQRQQQHQRQRNVLAPLVVQRCHHAHLTGRHGPLEPGGSTRETNGGAHQGLQRILQHAEGPGTQVSAGARSAGRRATHLRQVPGERAH